MRQGALTGDRCVGRPSSSLDRFLHHVRSARTLYLSLIIPSFDLSSLELLVVPVLHRHFLSSFHISLHPSSVFLSHFILPIVHVDLAELYEFVRVILCLK